MFLDRMSQLDLRFTKVFRFASNGRVKAMIDLYNVLNGNTVLSVNNTYGAAWQRPLTMLPGRLFKFGAQVDF